MFVFDYRIQTDLYIVATFSIALVPNGNTSARWNLKHNTKSYSGTHIQTLKTQYNTSRSGHFKMLIINVVTNN